MSKCLITAHPAAVAAVQQAQLHLQGKDEQCVQREHMREVRSCTDMDIDTLMC